MTNGGVENGTAMERKEGVTTVNGAVKGGTARSSAEESESDSSARRTWKGGWGLLVG